MSIEIRFESVAPPQQFHRVPNRAWGLIYTRARAEKKVQSFLDGMAIPNYLPLLYKPRSRNRVSQIPMFPGYLFASWGAEDWKNIGFCSGIVSKIDGVLNCDDDIMRDMEKLYKIEELSKTQEVTLSAAPDGAADIPDDALQSGPVVGLRGFWQTVNGVNTFIVRLNVMGMTYEASIEESSIFKRVS